MDDVRRVLECYPRIFFACHTRHRRDPRSKKLLSAHQGSILDHLDNVEPTTLAGLAAHMGVTPSTMSLSIDRLERRGYVIRKRDAQDKRRVQLRLTQAGVRVKEAQSVLEPARVKGMLEGLPPEERSVAVAGLALLARAASEYMSSSPKKMVGLGRGRSRKSRRFRK